MTTETNIPEKTQTNAKILAGLLIIAIGGILLVNQMDLILLPRWLFAWPAMLVIVALFVGAKTGFDHIAFMIILCVGLIFMANDALPSLNLTGLIAPAVIIITGVWLIRKKELFGKHGLKKQADDRDHYPSMQPAKTTLI